MTPSSPDGQAARGSGLWRWVRAQAPYRYWRVAGGGIVLLYLWWNLIVHVESSALVDLYVLAFVALPLMTLAIYWREQLAARIRLPERELLRALGAGAVAGLIAALLLDSGLGAAGGTFGGAVLTALIDVLFNGAALVLVLRMAPARRELDGLLLGLATALGFLALRTVVAAWDVYSATASLGGLGTLFEGAMRRVAIANMDATLGVAFWLALAGQTVWMAALGAALCREPGAERPHQTQLQQPSRDVWLTAAGVFVLHFLFTLSYGGDWLALYVALVVVPGFALRLFALLVLAAGIILASFFLDEALRSERTADQTPSVPLEQAMPAYLRDLWARLRQLAGSTRTTPAG
jgi:RsiW-degrading membrane proteinase PrsW (M82 family)